MTATLCAATFSNSYVKGRKRCVMLRFVAVPVILPSGELETNIKDTVLQMYSIFRIRNYRKLGLLHL